MGREQFAQVVRGLVPCFGREENDFDIISQVFTELRELIFGASTEEVLNVINAEDSDVDWIDGFTLEHMGDASDGSDDDMWTFLQSSHFLVDVGPTDGEVGGDERGGGRNGNRRLYCLCGFTGRSQDDCLSSLDGVV